MREKKGGYFIDWSDFEETVTQYIKGEVQWYVKDKKGPHMIPQRDIIEFIMNEYDCSWTSAKTKLSLFVDMKRNLEWFIIMDRPNVPYPTPYIRNFVIYKP